MKAFSISCVAGAATCTIVAMIVAAFIGFIALQGQFIFPNRDEGAMDRPPPKGAEQLWLHAKDGSRVEGWLFLPQKTPAPAVIFIHGNSEYIEHRLEYAEFYAEHGFAVLLMEYRGYRRSTGEPSEEALVEDGQGFFDLLAARADAIAPDRIVLHGSSLGGAVAAEVAATRPARALILQSTFDSLPNLLQSEVFVPGFLIRQQFNTRAAVATYDGPVMVIHGDKDEIVALKRAKKIVEANPRARLTIVEGDHDLPHDWKSFGAALLSFLDEVGLASSLKEGS